MSRELPEAAMPLCASAGIGHSPTKMFVFVVLRCVEVISVIALVVGLVGLVKKASSGGYKFNGKEAASVVAGLVIGLVVIGLFGAISSLGGEFLRGVLLLLVFVALGAVLEVASSVVKFDVDGVAILIPIIIGGGLYFLVNGVNYAPLDLLDSAKALTSSGGSLAFFVDGAMQVINPLCAFCGPVVLLGRSVLHANRSNAVRHWRRDASLHP